MTNLASCTKNSSCVLRIQVGDKNNWDNNFNSVNIDKVITLLPIQPYGSITKGNFTVVVKDLVIAIAKFDHVSIPLNIICGYKCSEKSNLTVHINSVHNGKMTHYCEICEAKFSTKTNLTRHKETVHERKNHWAVFCNRFLFLSFWIIYSEYISITNKLINWIKLLRGQSVFVIVIVIVIAWKFTNSHNKIIRC